MTLTKLRIIWENGTQVEGWVASFENRIGVHVPIFTYELDTSIKGCFAFIGHREEIVAVLVLEEKEATSAGDRP